jgi:arylsulfatase A-like enzyme
VLTTLDADWQILESLAMRQPGYHYGRTLTTPFYGEHRLKTGKGPVNEEDVRMPLLIRGVIFPKGVNVNQFVANIDLAPPLSNLLAPRLA